MLKLYSNNSYRVYSTKDRDFILSHSTDILTWKSLESNVKTVELEKEIMFGPLDDNYFDETRTVDFDNARKQFYRTSQSWRKAIILNLCPRPLANRYSS